LTPNIIVGREGGFYSVYYASINREPKIRREVDVTYAYREGVFRRNGPSER